jgi:hypothetical protein
MMVTSMKASIPINQGAEEAPLQMFVCQVVGRSVARQRRTLPHTSAVARR